MAYCLFLALWSTVMIEAWKRRENELAHIWNMMGYFGSDTERSGYIADVVID